DDVGRGLRAVVWERAAGQVVLTMLAVVAVLLARPFAGTVPSLPPWGLPAVVAAVLITAMAITRSGVGLRAARVTVADLRGLVQPRRLGGIVLASLAVLGGHVATFWIATRAVDVRMPLVDLLPVALVILLVA